MTDQFKQLLDTNPRPYTDAWWWSQDGGQRVARIMMEMMQHNDNTNAHYSHDFVVMVAKKAVEAGFNAGWGVGHIDGYEDARRRWFEDN